MWERVREEVPSYIGLVECECEREEGGAGAQSFLSLIGVLMSCGILFCKVLSLCLSTCLLDTKEKVIYFGPKSSGIYCFFFF